MERLARGGRHRVAVRPGLRRTPPFERPPPAPIGYPPPVPPLPALPDGFALPAQVGVVFLVALVAMLFLRWFLLSRLKVWARGTTTHVDDLVLAAVTTPSIFWCVALAIEAGVHAAPLDPDLQQLFARSIALLLVTSITLVAAHVAGGATTLVLRRSAPDANVPGLGQAIVRGVVLLLGGMIVLNMLGVQIAPLLTALGVGGLAVALALQDTLTNFFAGIHILLERPYTIGHFIKLEDGQEGHVLDIGWRTTRVRTLMDDVIVVPNSKMAGSTILNYHMPIKRSRVVLPVGVAYGSDADRVRDVLLEEVAAARLELGYILETPAAEALLVRFGASSLDFELRFLIDDIAKQPYALDAVHRRVLRRFRAEGITIPYQTIRIEQE